MPKSEPPPKEKNTAKQAQKTSAPSTAEILDTDSVPSPSWPAWENPEIVGFLTESDEPREWNLASAVLRLQHNMDGHLLLARDAKDLRTTRAEFEAAVATGRALLKAFRNLYDYHHKGVQRIVKDYSEGPRIGQREKIARSTRVDSNTSQGRILERLDWTAQGYRELGQRFAHQAAAVETDPARLWHDGPGMRGTNEAARWNKLSAAAFEESTRFDGLYTKLERAGVQIVLVESRLGRTEQRRRPRKLKKKPRHGRDAKA